MLHDNFAENSCDTMMVDILDELDSEEEIQLIMDRISKVTINEIAKKSNVSRETIRKKIKKILYRFENKFV